MNTLMIIAALYCTPMHNGQLAVTPRARQVCIAKFKACSLKGYTDNRDLISCAKKVRVEPLLIVTGR